MRKWRRRRDGRGAGKVKGKERKGALVGHRRSEQLGKDPSWPPVLCPGWYLRERDLNTTLDVACVDSCVVVDAFLVQNCWIMSNISVAFHLPWPSLVLFRGAQAQEPGLVSQNRSQTVFIDVPAIPPHHPSRACAAAWHTPARCPPCGRLAIASPRVVTWMFKEKIRKSTQGVLVLLVFIDHSRVFN